MKENNENKNICSCSRDRLMFDFLNKLGLPLKYAILSFFGVIIGIFLANTFGYGSESLNYVTTPIAGAVGGAISGWMRQRKGKTD